MTRSRSSFDLSSAIAAAASLAGPLRTRAEPTEATVSDLPPPFEGVELVSFVVPATSGAEPPVSSRTLPPDPIRGTPPPPAPASPPSDPPPSDAALTQGRAAMPMPTPPKLPDLSAIVSPIVRCEKIVEWISEATGASEVFLADGAGLPLAGAIYEAESRLAGAGGVAASVLTLAGSIPGATSPLFEMHLGEGPFFQLIGFQAGSALYVVGLTRAAPLTPRQAHAIRLACRHALGATLQGES